MQYNKSWEQGLLSAIALLFKRDLSLPLAQVGIDTVFTAVSSLFISRLIQKKNG